MGAGLTEILPERTVDGDGKPEFSELKAKAKKELGDSALSKTVSKILDEVGNDVGEIRTRLETAYDDHMERASGWYKRRARTVQLIAAAVIVLAFNLNVSRVADTLYTDSEKREALVGLAGQFDCSVAGEAEETATGTEAGEAEGNGSVDCVDAVEGAIDSVEVRGLPMFWTMDDPFWGQFDQNVGAFLHVLLGYAIAWLGLLPGSRFWFDALAKLNSLRSGGKPPTKADADKT